MHIDCSARKAVRFYAGRIAYWRAKMGGDANDRARQQTGRHVTTGALARQKIQALHGCPRYLSHVLQRKARAAHRAYDQWVEYHWHWWKWMPEKWQRVGACETGYGKRPGSFTWDSGTYVSFAGIIRGGYASVAHSIGLPSWDEAIARTGRPPTPRQQVLTATALQARYGWGAWGCGGA